MTLKEAFQAAPGGLFENGWVEIRVCLSGFGPFQSSWYHLATSADMKPSTCLYQKGDQWLFGRLSPRLQELPGWEIVHDFKLIRQLESARSRYDCQ